MMENDFQRSISLRVSRRGDHNAPNQQTKDAEESGLSPRRLYSDSPLKIVWKKGFIRLVLVGGMIWMLLVLTALSLHIWSCQSSVAFFSAICNRESRVFNVLDSLGFVPKPPHRCSIPLMDDPDAVVIPPERTPDVLLRNISYILEDEETVNGSQLNPLFGGYISWKQREESFKLKPTMKNLLVHLFTPRDQLSFGYVVYRLKGEFKLYMFPNCEYNSLFVQGGVGEVAGRVQEEQCSERKQGRIRLVDKVVLPPITRASKAG